MIWLLSRDELDEDGNPIIEGYVPFLKRRYSEKDIRDMNKYSHTPRSDWSELAKMVMKIQGIAYGYSGDYFYQERVKRLYDVELNFFFEFYFFYINNDDKTEKYRKQVNEVLNQITFYKVKKVTQKEINEKIVYAKKEFNKLIDDKTLGYLLDGVYTNLYEIARNNTERFDRMISVLNYSTDNLFKDADENMIEEFKKPRLIAIFLLKIEE